MSDVDTSSPAGESTGTSAPTSLSLSAAADLMGQIDKAPAEAAPDEQRETEPNEPDDASQPADGPEDDGDDGEQSDPAAEPEQPAEPDESVELDRLHGNTKVRLRDGTEWTVGELKRRLDDVRQVDQARQEIEARRTEFSSQQSQFQQAAAQLAQRAQFFEQIAPQAMHALQNRLPQIPPMPDISLRTSDPFEYQAQMDDRLRAIDQHNAVIGEMQQIEQTQRQLAHERQQQEVAARQGFIQEQQRLLFEKIPDLKDDGKRAEFQGDFLKYGTEAYGFTVDELNETYDHRLIAMARDAFAYRKLKSQAPKPAQPAPKPAAVPVTKPGRRVPAAEASAQRRTELLDRAKSKPGGLSLADAASFISQIEGN